MNLIEKIKNREAVISVIGLGYIGLPLAALLAKKGFKVVGFDINKKRIEDINNKKCPFNEKGLAELIGTVVSSGKLKAHNNIVKSDVYIISVPTPLKDKKADLSYVKETVKSIFSVIDSGDLVIVESTVPPGTCKNIIKPMLDKNCKDYFLAHCPERAIPGNTLYEIQNNDRIIGGINEMSSKLAKELYKSFVKGDIFITDIICAEAVKLFENTYRDINIAIANEFYLICNRLGIDAKKAINLANKHPRVNILSPSHGVGGHCIPIDPWFLVQNNEELYNLIKEGRRMNDFMSLFVFNKIKEKLKNIERPTVTLLGLTYKPNVDDLRESPSLKVVDKCVKEGWKVKVHDPFVKKSDFLVDDFDKAIEGSNIVVLLTPHDFYKNKDFSKVNLLDLFSYLK